MNLSVSILRLIVDRPVNRKDLLMCLRQEGHVLTDRSMRDHIHNMISEEGYCIKSSEKGYELITKRQRLDEAVRYLDSYICEFAERKRMLIANFDRQTAKLVQLELDWNKSFPLLNP